MKKLTLNDLALTDKNRNSLKYYEVKTIEQLCQMTQVELLKLPGLGRKSLDNIIYELQKHGLGFGLSMHARGYLVKRQEPINRRVGTHENVHEYDGAFKCLDCQQSWGALTGKRKLPPLLCKELQAYEDGYTAGWKAAQKAVMSAIHQSTIDIKENIKHKLNAN